MSCLSELPSVFQWKDKALSGVVLLSLNFICLTLIFSSSGIVYLSLNFLLFFTIVSVAYVRLIAFVKNVPVNQEPAEDYAFISEDSVKNVLLKVFGCYKNLSQKIKGQKCSDECTSELKVILSLVVAGMLGDIFSIYTWILLGINATFVLTFLNNEKNIDCCKECHKYTDLAKTKIAKVVKKIPKYSDLKKE